MQRLGGATDHRGVDRNRRSRRRRVVILAFAVAVAGSSAFGSGPATAAPPGYDLVKSERVLGTNSSVQYDLCIDETVRVGAYVVIAETYRNQQGQELTLGRFTGQTETVKAASSNSNVASVRPGTWRQGKAWRGGRAPFAVTGVNAGSATVTLSDGRGIVAPFPITFDVHECHYEISLSGTWRITIGFRPTIHQSVTNLRLDPDGGVPTTYTASANARNQATAPNYGDCTVTYSVPSTLVWIKATEDANRPNRLQLEITYQGIPDSQPLVCHVPYGVYTGRGAGKLRPIRLPITLHDNFAEVFVPDHILDADGEWPGLTRITVKKVRS